MKHEYIKLTLPLPPSVNGLYKNARKWRIKTDAYKHFEEAVRHLFIQMDVRYSIIWNKWLNVEYSYFIPCYTKSGKKRKVDVENYIKATSDVLGKNIEWFDDSRIKNMIIRKNDSERKEVDITIKEL